MTKRKSALPHLEAAAPGVEAFFVVGLEAVNRIEFVEISLQEVIFRVVYPERSYEIGFLFSKPYIYPDPLKMRIRLAEETYKLLYTLADSLMHAALAGVQSAYAVNHKAFFRLNGGEQFQVRIIHSYVFAAKIGGRDYEYRCNQGEYFLKGMEDGIPDRLRPFLHHFSRLAMKAYKPYERVEGEMLEALSLLPDHESEPPKKVRNMRMARKREELEARGLPAPVVPKKRTIPAFNRNLFETRTLK